MINGKKSVAAGIEEFFLLPDAPLYLATTTCEGRDNAWIISYATRFSLSPDPVYMIVCVSHENLSHEMVEKSGVLALHILKRDQWPWISRFGRQSARSVDKLDGVPYERRATGSPIIPGTVGYLDCRIIKTVDDIDVGDHTCHIASVLDWGIFDPAPGPILSVADARRHGFA